MRTAETYRRVAKITIQCKSFYCRSFLSFLFCFHKQTVSTVRMLRYYIEVRTDWFKSIEQFLVSQIKTLFTADY